MFNVWKKKIIHVIRDVHYNHGNKFVNFKNSQCASRRQKIDRSFLYAIGLLQRWQQVSDRMENLTQGLVDY